MLGAKTNAADGKNALSAFNRVLKILLGPRIEGFMIESKKQIDFPWNRNRIEIEIKMACMQTERCATPRMNINQHTIVSEYLALGV